MKLKNIKTFIFSLVAGLFTPIIIVSWIVFSFVNYLIECYKDRYIYNELYKKYVDIIVNRQGLTEESYMKTEKVIGEIKPNQIYKLSRYQLVETDTVTEYTKTVIKPKTVTFTGQWIDQSESENQSNILGGVGLLLTDEKEIIIPIAETTQEHLNYFGVRLINNNDSFLFETDTHLPLTKMSVGSEYIEDYMLQEKFANGVYLEQHNRPHFHYNNDFGLGFIVFGKKNNDCYELTAFRIPYFCGIYTPPNTIHNDCFLIGNYDVVYSKTPEFSTVKIHTKTESGSVLTKVSTSSKFL